MEIKVCRLRKEKFWHFSYSHKSENLEAKVLKKLMVFLEKIAQKQSYKIIRLSVSPKNYNAIDFYLKLGYKKIHSSNDDFWDGNMEKSTS